MKDWIPDANWQVDNFGKMLIILGLFVGVIALILYFGFGVR